MSRPTSPQYFTVAHRIAAVARLLGRRKDAVAAAVLTALTDLDADDPRRVESELWPQFDEQLAGAWARGWQPGELADYVGRLGVAAGRLVTDAIAAEQVRYAAATVDPRWRAQLDQLGGARRVEAGRSRLDELACALATTRSSTLVTALTALGVVMHLPALQRLLPVPGQARRCQRCRQSAGRDRPEGARPGARPAGQG